MSDVIKLNALFFIFPFFDYRLLASPLAWFNINGPAHFCSFASSDCVKAWRKQQYSTLHYYTYHIKIKSAERLLIFILTLYACYSNTVWCIFYLLRVLCTNLLRFPPLIKVSEWDFEQSNLNEIFGLLSCMQIIPESTTLPSSPPTTTHPIYFRLINICCYKVIVWDFLLPIYTLIRWSNLHLHN